MKNFKFSVKDDTHGRVDTFLAAHVKDLSKRKIRLVLDRGGVFLNGKRVRVASRRVQIGDRIEMHYVPDQLKRATLPIPDLTPQDILYKSRTWIALNKPPLLPAQATKDQSIAHVLTALKKLTSLSHLILVHRLDKETSGVLLVALTKETATNLTEQFKGHTIKKTYEAVCWGRPKKKNFKCENHLSDIHPKTGLVREVQAGGKRSLTHFEVIEISEKYPLCLIRCYPHTGRTHQIRVHLADAGFPIVGDKKYGKPPEHNSLPFDIQNSMGEHHLLHALEIEFKDTDFSSRPKAIKAEHPPLFLKLLKLIKS